MKKVVAILIVLLPLCSRGQNTSVLEQEVDSLLQLSRILTEKRDFEQALALNAAAEKLILENGGKETADFGNVCFNRGAIYLAQDNSTEAEKWFLSAKTIQENTPGKEHPEYANTLSNLGNLLYLKGKNQQAESLLLEALAIQEKALGKEHPDYATSLNILGAIYLKLSQFDKAEPLFWEAKNIREKTQGKTHPDYATALNSLGSLYTDKEEYKKAEPYYLEALAIRENALGKEHPKYAANLNSLASLYDDMGLYEKAEPLYLQAIDIQEKTLGRLNARFATSLNNLGVLYINKGQYDQAEKYYLESKDIRAKVLGKSHPQYAASLNNLGNLGRKTGKYEAAEQYHLEAKAIRGKVYGKESAHYGASLNNLANLYQDMGHYDQAELLHGESKAIKEKIGGTQSLDYADCLNNLAIIYSNMCEYEKAEAYYQEALNIREKKLGKEHPDYAAGLNNLASLYRLTNQYAKAEQLYLEALSFREKTIGKEHPEYAQNLKNLGLLYFAMKNLGKAESYLLESTATTEKTLGKEHPEYPRALQGLAYLYLNQHRYQEAEAAFLEVESIRKNVFGIDYYDYTATLNALATLYQVTKDDAKAKQYLSDRIEGEKSLMLKASTHLSSRELWKYTNQFATGLAQNLSFAQTHREMSGSCYDNILFHKGFLLAAMSRIINLAKTDSATTQKFNLLKSNKRRLAAEYTKPILKRSSADITMLEEQANSLEKELAQTVAGYAEARRQVTWQEVQTTLQPGEAAIEFVHYRFNSPEPTDSIMYAALIVRPGDAQPQFIPLFEEKEITPLLKNTTGGSNFLKINALYANKTPVNQQKNLYQLVWQPLESYLKGVRTVYCSPSGLLHRLNLAAIPTPEGGMFGASCQLTALESTRQLVAPNAQVVPNNFAYLAGGIRYDADSTAVMTANKGRSMRRGASTVTLPFQPDSLNRINSETLGYLPATADEVRDIAETLVAAGIQPKVDTGFYATEEAFRLLGTGTPSPRIIHLATHGYFFPDPKNNDQNAATEQEPAVKASEHPMIRSGLILAGAQKAWLGGSAPAGLEDGILTAYEISQMNLSNTELVVLSACETGLGDIVGNEGVYGLQRAFKIAGAKYLIMSLWKVDDKHTKTFMTNFYQYWLRKKLSIPQAFRSAQADMRAKYPSAFDWASFVLIE